MISFHSDFECGNGTDFRQEENVVFFRIRPDTESSDRQWFFFCLKGGKGQALTFCLEGTQETNITTHWDNARPVFSSDGGKTWSRVQGETRHDAHTGRFYFGHRVESEEELIAFHHPYTYNRNLKQIAKWKQHHAVKPSVIGHSVEKRPIDLLRVHEGGEANGKIGIWVTSRQHAAETNASFFLDGFMDWLLSDAADAQALRHAAVVNVVPMINPDGAVAGNYRDNIKGVNLNRVWNEPDAKTSPEICALTDAVKQWVTSGNRFDFFIDLHGDAEAYAHYAFHAGPEIKPANYPEPERYHEDTVRYLRLLAARNPDFTVEEGASGSDSIGLSRQFMTFTYGVMAILFEGGYSYVNYGPKKGEWLAPERHEAVGQAAGRALVDYFQLWKPAL